MATLGLGSRANKRSVSAMSLVRGANGTIPQNISSNTPTTVSKLFVPSRPSGSHGFFFTEEEDVDSDFSDVQQTEPVAFSGDISGFAGLGDYTPDQRSTYSKAGSPTKSSSRISALATPSRSRKNSIASRRATPYNTTTTRALQRARRESQGSTNEEETLIGESMFGDAPAQESPRKKHRFVMKGALVNTDASNHEYSDGEPQTYLERSPSKNLFSRKAKSPRRQPELSSPQNNVESGLAKISWGEWVKSIFPSSILKPVTSVMGPSTTSKRSPKNRNIFATPEKDRKDFELNIPGSFEKASSTRNDKDYINPNFLDNDFYYQSPTKKSQELFQYPQNSLVLTKLNGKLESTPLTKKGSRVISSRVPMSAPPVSFRNPSNFIQRMRSIKKRRYDPYSRPSTKLSIETPPAEEVDRELGAEEQLELLERRERDRKVQEAEDRYLRRETLRKLGRSVEEDEMQDVTPKVQNKGKVAYVEEDREYDEMDEDQTTSTTPPASPPRKPNSLPFFSETASQTVEPPLFQNIVPSTFSLPAADKPTFSNPGSFTSELENDKENVSDPPPPPTISHRELPATTPPSTALPSVISNPNLFGNKQPVSGFVISAVPSSTSAPPSPAPAASPSINRQRFDKFKPRVSSSLRESATIEKENEHDKENPSDNGGEGSSSSGGKPHKAAFGTLVVNKSSSSSGAGTGALREVQRNAPVQSNIKIDIRAKIAALPVQDLSLFSSWPGVEIVTTGDMKIQEAVKNAWTSEFGGDWARGIFGFAAAKVEKM